MRTLETERVPVAEVAAILGITEYQIANYVYQIRQRIREYLWLSLFDLEKTDRLGDTIVAVDMAIRSTISAQTDGSVESPATAADIEQAFREEAKESAAALAADYDMQELFGLLPKCRKDKRMPSR